MSEDIKQKVLNVGDKLPYFQAKDQEGRDFNSDELYGAPSVVYFYPKDDTPGCTAEACSFRDAMEELETLEVRVVGISPDDVASHQNFQKKYNINFTLLADDKHEVSQLFGVWKERQFAGNSVMAIERTTFVIDDEGIIRWIERPVNVEGHLERVMNALEEFGNEISKD